MITYRTRRGHLVEFLTNEFDLEPGLIAFLYSRRWEPDTVASTYVLEVPPYRTSYGL